MCVYYDAHTVLIISAGSKVNIRIIYEFFSPGDRCKSEASETDTPGK
jgi:hypothetical protein